MTHHFPRYRPVPFHAVDLANRHRGGFVNMTIYHSVLLSVGGNLLQSFSTLDRLAEAVICMEDDVIADMALQHCYGISRSRAHVDLGTIFEWNEAWNTERHEYKHSWMQRRIVQRRSAENKRQEVVW